MACSRWNYCAIVESEQVIVPAESHKRVLPIPLSLFLSRFTDTVSRNVRVDCRLYLLLFTMKNTPKFRTPPRFVNIVLIWNITDGVFPTNDQTPNSPAINHWMKKAATKSDIFFAAVMDVLSWLLLSWPKFLRINVTSDRIFHHERRYRRLFKTKIISSGIEMSDTYVVQPLTPSVRQLKGRNTILVSNKRC